MKRLILFATVIIVGLIIQDVIKADKFIPKVIKVYDESEVDSLQRSGVEILRRRGDILLCFVPNDSTSDETGANINDGMPDTDKGLKRRKRVRPISGGHLNTPTLDVAVNYFDANKILCGNGFEHSFTGKGVVVGLCDIGFDPLHPTFLDKYGKSRVKRVTQYKECEGIRLEIEGDDQYTVWRTDTTGEYHATHVCGILAGNGAGTPYAGIARDADIVASVSTLTDVGILAGVEDIIDYAKSEDKPCVINMSVGNYVGAHDGSSLTSQYLDLCAEDAIIVLSAGNEGSHTNSLRHEFTEETPTVSFRLGNRKWNQISMYGETDIWSSDGCPLKVQLSIYDDETKQTVFSYPEMTLTDDEEILHEWHPDKPAFAGLDMDGMIAATGGIERENGRYRVILEYRYESPQLVTGKSWARYVVRVDVKGSQGSSVDVFADGTYTRLMGVDGIQGNPVPNTNMSISDLACGERVISVGMYGNRSAWPVTEPDASGEMTQRYVDTGYGEGLTVAHSSYGCLRDGRALPLTTAPGAPLVSSFSRPYMENHPEEPHLDLGSCWVSESGTSMSAPYVAGFIATWLEADPTLTVEDVQQLISGSNRHDIDDPGNPRNVNGWFDPLAAMSHLAAYDTVGEITDGGDKINPDEKIEIYSIDGTIVFRGCQNNCPKLSPGLYIRKTAAGTNAGFQNHLVRRSIR